MTEDRQHNAEIRPPVTGLSLCLQGFPGVCHCGQSFSPACEASSSSSWVSVAITIPSLLIRVELKFLYKYKSWFQLSCCCLFSVWAPRGQWSAGWPKTLSCSPLLAECCKPCWYEPIRLPTWTVGWSQEELTALSLFTKRSTEEAGYIFLWQPPLHLPSDLVCGERSILIHRRRADPASVASSYQPQLCVSSGNSTPSHSLWWLMSTVWKYLFVKLRSFSRTQTTTPALCLCLILYKKGTIVAFQTVPIPLQSEFYHILAKPCLFGTYYTYRWTAVKRDMLNTLNECFLILFSSMNTKYKTFHSHHSSLQVVSDTQKIDLPFSITLRFFGSPLNIKFSAEELVYWLSLV